tara:strand:+ start:787 stop:1512 length:726 start_codon:yes stop_codon:yes gene_type:complete
MNWYIKHYGVNTAEMVGTKEDYSSLSQFFVRPLIEGARPVCADLDALVSPSDGRAVAFGQVLNNTISLPDGQELSVEMLSKHADKFSGGSYLIIYLAPPDYHRVHSPVKGTITGYNYLPGHLWPVFPVAVRDVRDLFGRNERLLIHFQSEKAGSIGLIMVGAYGVGRMETTFCDVVTNSGGKAEARELDKAANVEKGSEIGRFNMGSTVIMLFEPGCVEFEMELDQVVCMGQRIGKCLGAG